MQYLKKRKVTILTNAIYKIIFFENKKNNIIYNIKKFFLYLQN